MALPGDRLGDAGARRRRRVARTSRSPASTRDARTLRFADGPDEVHRNAIAKIELGKRRRLSAAAGLRRRRSDQPLRRGRALRRPCRCGGGSDCQAVVAVCGPASPARRRASAPTRSASLAAISNSASAAATSGLVGAAQLPAAGRAAAQRHQHERRRRVAARCRRRARERARAVLRCHAGPSLRQAGDAGEAGCAAVFEPLSAIFGEHHQPARLLGDGCRRSRSGCSRSNCSNACFSSSSISDFEHRAASAGRAAGRAPCAPAAPGPRCRGAAGGPIRAASGSSSNLPSITKPSPSLLALEWWPAPLAPRPRRR